MLVGAGGVPAERETLPSTSERGDGKKEQELGESGLPFKFF